MGICIQIFNIILEKVKEWQTLIAALLALGAAILTIRKMQRQIDQQERFRQDDIIKRRKQILAQLPNALGNVFQYTIKSIDGLKEESIIPIEPPVADLEMLIDSISFVEMDLANEIEGYIKCYHAFRNTMGLIHNRTEMMETRPHPKDSKVDLSMVVISAAYLLVRNDRIFGRLDSNRLDAKTERISILDLFGRIDTIQFLTFLKEKSDVIESAKRQLRELKSHQDGVKENARQRSAKKGIFGRVISRTRKGGAEPSKSP